MGSFQLGRGERLQCWRNTLRSFVISPSMVDFAYRLNVAAADYAGSCAVAQRVDAFEEAVWFEPRPIRMGSLWFGGVLVFVCVELAAAERSRKRT
jgi:hypothetical protein